MGWVTRRLSYANAMATIAVFGLLAGGAAYAGGKIGAKQIKRNAAAAVSGVPRGLAG